MTEPATSPPDRILLDLAPSDVHTASVPTDPVKDGKPKACALAIVMGEWGGVLTVSRPEPPHEMALPGGEIEDGETPERAAAREILEETGLSIHDLVPVCELVSPTDGRPVHIFRAGRWSGCAAPLEPNTKVSWIGIRELLSQSMLYRKTLEQLIEGRHLGATEPHVMSISAAKRRLAKAGGRGRRGKASKAAGDASDAQHGNATPKGALHVRADLAPGGSLHVRHHMSDRAFYDGEGVLLTESSAGDDGKPVWNQIAKSGAFAGHPRGPFELNTKVFSQIIANFRATTNRRIAVDYEHASEMDPTSGSIPTSGAPAQGWVVDMEIRGTDLWGLFEWLPQAREQVRTGAYKFLSPAIRFDSKDRRTGEKIGARLTSVALTNEPFLDGMQPLAARDTGAAAVVTMAASDLSRPVHASHEYMPALKACMGLHPLASAQECSDHLDRLRECCMTAGPSGTHEGVDLSTYTKGLRDLVKAAPGTTWDEVFDTVQDLIDAAIEEHEAKYHTADATMSDPDTETEDTTMTAQDNATLLRDANTKVTTLEGEKAVWVTEKQTLTSSLKDEKTRADGLATTIREIGCLLVMKDGESCVTATTRIVAENAALLADKAKRDETDLEADVENAFATYKDAMGLTDAKKPAMKVLAKADRGAFNAMYPPVAPDKRHLLRAIVPTEPRTAEQQASALSFTALTHKIMTDEKVSYSQAQVLASERLAKR